MKRKLFPGARDKAAIESAWFVVSRRTGVQPFAMPPASSPRQAWAIVAAAINAKRTFPTAADKALMVTRRFRVTYEAIDKSP